MKIERSITAVWHAKIVLYRKLLLFKLAAITTVVWRNKATI